MPLAGVEFQVFSDVTVVQLALQFDRFDFSDESLVVGEFQTGNNENQLRPPYRPYWREHS
jgi:hypothetical protein